MAAVVYYAPTGDLKKADNVFARANTVYWERNEAETRDLQLAALQRRAKRAEEEAAPPEPEVKVAGPDGVPRALTMSNLRTDVATRAALLHEVATQAEDVEDQIASLLQRVRQRFDRAGVPMQDVQIRFKGLSVSGMAAVRSLKPLPSSLLVEAVRRARAAAGGKPNRRMKRVHLLQDISSVLRPGRFTLLLGPPGAGKTVLMKALSGQLKREGIKVEAEELTYNGKALNEFVVERTAQYINQDDIHFGELTVQETLRFAALCQSSQTRKHAEVLLEEKEKELGITPDPVVAKYMEAVGEHYRLAADIAIKALGLEGCADTLVGNSMIRGISGGQRKRVTSGEMLVGPSNVLFADEISTGLDSATTFEICSRLRALCHLVSGTVMVSLLQPTPETYNTFDDIMLLSGGRLVFHGPREMIMPFFEGQGFACPLEKGDADFLQEVTTVGEQQLYWSRPEDYEYVGDALFAERYRSTEAGRGFSEELALSAEQEERGHGQLAVHKYAQDDWTLFKAGMDRQAKLFLRNRAFIVIRLAQCVIMGILVGTLFLGQTRDDLQDAQMYMSVAFFSIMTQLVVSFAAPGLLVERLPVYYRQRDAHFMPAWCFALPEILLQVPLIATEATIWTAMVYFMVGFDVSARVLVFWTVMFVAGVFGLTLFMLVALPAKTITVAAAIQNLSILIFTIASGFIVTFDSLKGPWKGAYYANPVSYFLQALVVNEFESDNWGGPAPDGAAGTAGDFYMKQRGYFTGQHWIWIGIVVWGCGATLLNTLVYVTAASFLTIAPKRKISATLHEVDASMHGSVRGGSVHSDSVHSVSLKPARSGSASLKVGDAEEGGVAAAAVSSSALPFCPVRMTFRDVRYSVPMPAGYADATASQPDDPHAGRLLLLKGISGAFRPGVLTALMGSSGAGKTTLMDVLALRKTGGTITGDIRVNGYPQQASTFTRIMGYCEQTDIHVAEATVHEALRFSARLRLPSSVPAATVESFVEEVMDVVELTPLANSLVGVPGMSGLSVEQRKRLTLAVELVANPSIVFCDEPTSGLDARAASIVMRAIRRTTSTGRCVVCTIHQPSTSIFLEFDELLLLKRGGQTIFFGELGKGASSLVSYFEAFPGVPAMEKGYNPATYMLEVSNPAAEAECGLEFADAYAASDLFHANEARVQGLSEPREGEADLKLADLAPASQLVQLRELLRRNLAQYARLKSYNGTRLFLTICFAVFFGTVLEGQGDNTFTYNGILNLTGVQYSSVMFVGILNAMMIQSIISVRRTVFYRERAGGTYGVLPFSAAEFLVEVPCLALQAAIYSNILYWTVGFTADAGKFFYFLLVLFLTLCYWTFFGIQNVQITPSLAIANAFTSFCYSVFDVACGYYKPQPIIPRGWVWLYYLDPVSYTLYGLVVGELGDQTEQLMLDQEPQVSVAQFVEDYFGYKYSFRWWLVLILAGFSCAFFALSTTALYRIKWQTR